MDIQIRSATVRDQKSLESLLPELADFDLPNRRKAIHLWESDAALLGEILDGKVPNSFVDVAEDQEGERKIVGFVIVSMRDEMLSQRPSAHLETIVVHPDVRGLGIGRQLMWHTEQKVRHRGAESLTLRVFSQNHRARHLYESEGFESELIRAIKWL